MPNERKGGRRFGALFGHRKGLFRHSKHDILSDNDKNDLDGSGSCRPERGVRKEDILWDSQGRILNWKSILREIQKQVRI